ncbi:MAG: tRNA dihydrouridine synthase DusB [Oscillospiraceae bacterium]|nr:tRNA dihydrouridine synthase DusB [Oscillospiraceae bacterium]
MLNISHAIYLAPMAGVTDWAYRAVCRQFAPIVTVSEMVSAKALVYQDSKTSRLLRKDGSPYGVQLFGSEPDTMAKAAVIALEKSGADFLDINMGCPTPKIVKNGDGCALMQSPALCGEIVAAVAAAVDVPVTVKLRLGWDRGSLNAAGVAKICEDAGAAAVCVHGRTRAQQYGGRADWDAIAEVKAALGIPVIANGDICSAETAVRALKRSKADAVMVGRAALGNPFIFRELYAVLSGLPVPAPPDIRERARWAGEQFRLMREDKGERVAVLEARKHFCWYLHGLPYSQRYKREIIAMNTAEDAERVLEQWV